MKTCHCWKTNKQPHLFGNGFLRPWYTDTRLFRTIDRIRSETEIRDQGLARDQVYESNPEPTVKQLDPGSILFELEYTTFVKFHLKICRRSKEN